MTEVEVDGRRVQVATAQQNYSQTALDVGRVIQGSLDADGAVSLESRNLLGWMRAPQHNWRRCTPEFPCPEGYECLEQRCEPGDANPCEGLADGDYCADNGPVGYEGAPNDLLTCLGGAITQVISCAAGCLRQPPGTPDRCTDDPCALDECQCGCANGLCAPLVCAAGDRRCTVDGAIETCPTGCGWEPSEACPCGCDSGWCIQLCLPGERRCSTGGDVETCDPRGCTWGVGEDCDCGCANGVCAARVCNPGDRRCNGSGDVETCAATGCSWSVTLDCDCGCANGVCAARICNPGDRRCNGSGDVETCAASGCSWSVTQDCGAHNPCQNGACRCRDLDGDGHADLACGGDDCDDADAHRHPGHREVWDIRDNDCDGRQDEDGLITRNRYYKAWSASDWEHRFASSLPAGFEADGHSIVLYPSNFCGSAQYAPLDGCEIVDHGSQIRLWGGFTVVALSGCTGRLGQYHITLYLLEDGGEYRDYAARPDFTCTRLGYVYGGATGNNVGSAVQFYRHWSPFAAGGVGDNMWSPDPREGHPTYNQHDVHFKAPGGN